MAANDIHDLFFDEHDEIDITQRNLPHWKQDGKLYFITWRQADSLSQEILEQIRSDRVAWIKEHGDRPVSSLPIPLQNEYSELFHHRVQAWLDAGHGACLFRRPVVRKIMVDAFHHFNGKRYHLGSFALAGNHVHLLVAPLPGVDLSEVLHSWKSFTANAINKCVGQSGRLWMDENFDRLVRDLDHLHRIENYIAAHAKHGAYVERNALPGSSGYSP